jgi:hypothetical protein
MVLRHILSVLLRAVHVGLEYLAGAVFFRFIHYKGTLPTYCMLWEKVPKLPTPEE